MEHRGNPEGAAVDEGEESQEEPDDWGHPHFHPEPAAQRRQQKPPVGVQGRPTASEADDPPGEEPEPGQRHDDAGEHHGPLAAEPAQGERPEERGREPERQVDGG